MIMSEITNLRQLQQRIFQLTIFEDGLWDLLLGIIMMFLAIYPVTRELLGPVLNVVLFLGVMALAVAGQLLARRVISEPRIGYVQPRRSRGLRLILGITILMVLITFGLLLLTLLSPVSAPASDLTLELTPGRGYMVEIIVLLAMGGLFSALGYLFGVRRLYFYGWMLGFANLASVYMEHYSGWTFLIPLAIAAGIIMIVGLVLLIRFLRKYSPPDEEI
jgi:hypothetical protein